MAQTTSELWKELFRTRGVQREYGFDIAGVWYGPETEVTHSVSKKQYEDFGIGNAVTAMLTLNVFADNVPKGAEIRRYMRLTDGSRYSEWIKKGVFLINKRTEDDGYWTVEAFDYMRRAEKIWRPVQPLEFPLPMPDAVDEFARLMGVEVDTRTVLNGSYTIDYPANDYTIRNELQFIAAAHCGNWIMTDEAKLLLLPLFSAPPETNYLVTEYGDVITLGGVRILV